MAGDASAFPMGVPPQIPKIIGTSGTPAVAVLAAAGTGATATIVGSNVSGKITLNTGTSLVTGGNILTLTLADGASFPNGMHIQYSSSNANFAMVLTSIYCTTTNNSATLAMNGIALTTNTAYVGYYTISGY